MKTAWAHLHLESVSNKKSHKEFCNDKGHSLTFLILLKFPLKGNKKEVFTQKDLVDIQEHIEQLII